MATFHIQNFGCRATQSDGAAIEKQLLDRGLARVEAGAAPDVVVLNTCTVTAAADADARAAIRRIHRANPGCKIVVTGCYAQRAPHELARLAGVSRVVGNSHKHQIPELVASGLVEKQLAASAAFVPAASLTERSRATSLPVTVLVGDIFAHTEVMAAPVFESANTSGKTRPNLKIQDGCNNRCSFCVIPSVRGRSRSLRLEEVVREVASLVEAGYREVVLSGINLGRWGRDLAKAQGFEDLVRTILQRTQLEKLRLSSVEPMDWSDELIELMASEARIAKHVHAPLQSGSDRILRLMHRKYRPWHYAERIRKARAAMPDAAIGADVMVGFPGETDELFEESRAFIASLPFTYLHVFTFSPRPGTPAEQMPNQVPVHVARRRNQILRELAEGKNLAFRRSHIGKTVRAITLKVSGSSSTQAITDNYVRLELHGRHEPNRWINAAIHGLTAEGMKGTLQPNF